MSFWTYIQGQITFKGLLGDGLRDEFIEANKEEIFKENPSLDPSELEDADVFIYSQTTGVSPEARWALAAIVNNDSNIKFTYMNEFLASVVVDYGDRHIFDGRIKIPPMPEGSEGPAKVHIFTPPDYDSNYSAIISIVGQLRNVHPWEREPIREWCRFMKKVFGRDGVIRIYDFEGTEDEYF